MTCTMPLRCRQGLAPAIPRYSGIVALGRRLNHARLAVETAPSGPQALRRRSHATPRLRLAHLPWEACGHEVRLRGLGDPMERSCQH